MFEMTLITCLVIASGVEPVSLADPSFDTGLKTWTAEGSLTGDHWRTETRGGTPDTSTGQCLVLGPGDGLRTSGPFLSGLPMGTTLDINLSLRQIEAPGSSLKVELIDDKGSSLATQLVATGEAWTRQRVSIPGSAETAGVSWLRLGRSGGDGGAVLVDNIAVEQVGGKEPGFTSLFDGRTLEGWVGDTAGYEVVDGTIRCKPDGGGDLRSMDQYDDFILRFEFKLTAGGNNGIAVRAPVKGNAAYEGMEIQVLDNTADQYESLKPWQFHGSAYGIAPAERGWMLSPGEWNREEIRLHGYRLTVTLNGHVILDADIEAVLEAGPPSGQPHEGARRTMGHIGFCGHGSDVAFRDIRIRRLQKVGAVP